jgi:hypothetical protein
VGSIKQHPAPKNYLIMDNVFEARFRFKARKTVNKNGPDKNLMIDFTPEEAKKAATWLLEKATEAELGDSTIRKYTSKSDYQEIPGFTMWGSFWSNNESGSIAPRKD